MEATQHLVIIGNGIAGVTLAQQVRQQSRCRITLISAESPTHFARTALMYVYTGHMRMQDIVPYADWFWKEQQIERVHNFVEQIDPVNKRLTLRSGAPILYDKLVLATGSATAFYNWPGEQLGGVQGLVTLQDLELMERNTQGIAQAMVVGGGLIGVEMAEMLQSRGIQVQVLVRESLYWKNSLPPEEAQLVTDHIRSHGIELLLEEELAEILPDAANRVRAIRTKSGKELPCQFLGICTGVKPNVAFLRGSGIALDRGVRVNAYFETNHPEVYAIGDCAQFEAPATGEPVLEQLWYTARQHATTLAATLTGKRQVYRRGPWFNSAKFFDIEYQTYGHVPANLQANQHSFYWQDPTGTKAIRILYNGDTLQLLGINLLGVRYRHDLCQNWLENKYSIHQVMEELTAANFDPEFFQRYEQELLTQYYTRFPERQAPVRHSSWWELRKRFGLLSDSASC